MAPPPSDVATKVSKVGMKLLTKCGAIFDRGNGILVFLAGCFLAFMMLSVDAEIVARYFLNRPIKWVCEVCEYSMVWVVFLSTAWVLRREAHAKMELVLNWLKPEAQNMLNIITSVVGAIVCFIIGWYGAGVVWDHFLRGAQKQEMMAFPSAPIEAIIPIGCFLLFIQFLRRGYGYLRSRRVSSDEQ